MFSVCGWSNTIRHCLRLDVSKAGSYAWSNDGRSNAIPLAAWGAQYQKAIHQTTLGHNIFHRALRIRSGNL